MKVKVSLFMLALATILPLGAFASSSDDDDKQDMTLVKLPESTSPGGDGGGGCRDKIECDKRSTTTVGTSDVWSDTKRGTNFLDQDCDINPDFCRATAIHVMYCTSDSHRGSNDKPSEESFGYYFDGFLNFQAIIEKLIAEKGLGNASNVMLTGGSAGAIGALFNVDWLANRLSNVTVKSVPLAGWYTPGALADDLPAPYPPSDYPNFAAGDKGNTIYDIIQAGESPVDVWNITDALPADCLAEYGDEVGWWVCASAHFAYKYIKSSIFMVHTQYDSNQIFSGSQAPQVPANETEVDTVKRYVQFWGNATRESLQLIINDEYVTQKDHTDGVFAASCITHGTPGNVEIDGQTYRELVHDWFFQNGNFDDDKYKLIETCDPLEGNEDYVIPCNEAPSCEYKRSFDPDPYTCAAQLDLEGCLESFGSKTACISCASENSASLADAGCREKIVTAICTYAQNNEIPDEFGGDGVVIGDDDDEGFLPSSKPFTSPSSNPSLTSKPSAETPSADPVDCSNDPAYKFRIRRGKLRKCKFISTKNLANRKKRRAKYCYENDGFTVSPTGAACSLACGLCDSPLYPSVSPSLSLTPTTECSKPGQKSFQVEVNLDSSIKENFIVVKKRAKVCTINQCPFSKTVFRRNQRQFDIPNGSYNWRKCLNPNNCYLFQIFEAKKVGDGFTNKSGNYTVTWDGNVVKSSKFNTPGNLRKETVKFGNCDPISQQKVTSEQHKSTIFE